VSQHAPITDLTMTDHTALLHRLVVEQSNRNSSKCSSRYASSRQSSCLPASRWSGYPCLRLKKRFVAVSYAILPLLRQAHKVFSFYSILTGTRDRLLRPTLPSLHLVLPFLHPLRADIRQEHLQQALLKRTDSVTPRHASSLLSSPCICFQRSLRDSGSLFLRRHYTTVS